MDLSQITDQNLYRRDLWLRSDAKYLSIETQFHPPLAANVERQLGIFPLKDLDLVPISVEYIDE